MTFVDLGRTDKIKAFDEILIAAAVPTEQVAFIGDDLNDVPIMSRSGLAVAVADGSDDALAHAHYITNARGGAGAVREVIELILKAQNRWNDIVSTYLS